jgi:hypothetical protein
MRFIKPGSDISKIEGDGILLFATNSNINSLAMDLHLPADKFEKFECKLDKISIGLNIPSLYKLIKSINNDDNLTLFIEENDRSNINIKIENKSKNMISLYKLKLLDIEEFKSQSIKIDFTYIINMMSSNFHKSIKDMNNISESIEIQLIKIDNNYNYILVFRCKGNYASLESHIMIDSSSDIKIKELDLNKLKLTYSDNNGKDTINNSNNINDSGDSDDSDDSNNSNNSNNSYYSDTKNKSKNKSKNKLINKSNNEKGHEKIKSYVDCVMGHYDLKNLSLFSKCCSICNKIDIYIKNNSPLIIKY